MPTMSRVEQALCRSGPWNAFARKITSTALGGTDMSGDVLEIGGGSGAMAESIIGDYPGCRITVTDFDPAMVADAQRRLGSFAQVSVRVADATRLPSEDGSYDAVLSFLMLHHVVDWEAAVDEAGRVLRPGGTFSGYDLTYTKVSSAFHRLDRSPHRLIARGELERAASRAGFEVTTIRYVFLGHIMSFTLHKI